ncbi:alpha/beta hydrolase, partial [Achromobacter xylosoxidans]|nr:alpha/beta hydrolase [Achromobacter xylosoxidans]
HEIDGQTVYYYVWGDSGPRVLLVHGWGGDAAQMTAYVEPLRQHAASGFGGFEPCGREQQLLHHLGGGARRHGAGKAEHGAD